MCVGLIDKFEHQNISLLSFFLRDLIVFFFTEMIKPRFYI